MTLLSVDQLRAGYDGPDVIHGISVAVEADELVALLGPNGAGKTTTLRAIVGTITPTGGTVQFDGADVTGWAPHETYAAGMTLVPETQGVFPDLTVEENLQVPVVGKEARPTHEVLEYFPELGARRDAKGRHLSGGEAQMLAIGRALRRDPQLLLLDEPSEGLAPQAVDRLAAVIRELVAEGVAILLVEANVAFALRLAESGYLLADGEINLSGSASALRSRREELGEYIGITGRERG